MKRSSWQKITALLLMLFFFSYSFVFANFSLDELKIPSQIGTVKEVFSPDNPGLNPQPTIIQIQDAHCNYEAQKNLAKIIEYLIKEKKLRLVMVEGGSGDVSLSSLRGYTDQKARKEVAEKYLRMGKISGEEYLDIVSDYDFEIYGIEDQSLYDANLEAFLGLENYRQDGLNDLQNIAAAVQALKPHIYSEQLVEFAEKRSGYADKTISLSEYLDYLSDKLLYQRPGLEAYPHIQSFLESVRLEKELDFKLAETQRNTFIKELAKMLDENTVQELISKTKDFKDGRIANREYYTFLKDSARNKIDIRRDYPQLFGYIVYVNLGKNINTAELLKEMNLLENNIRESLLANNDQRRLSEIDQAVGALTDFLKLELTPEGYADFKNNRSNFVTASWMEFLADNCRRYGLAMQPVSSGAIDDNLERLEKFYKLGIEREQAFLQNLAKKMDAGQDKLAVLITGGFHTAGVSRLLKEKGYSYAVVTPAITQKTDSDIYFSVLRGETGRDDTTTDSD